MENDEVREESSARIRRAPSHDEASKHESNDKPHCHTVFKYLNLSVLAIVGVNYQAISQHPSKTLALYTWSFLTSILIYSLILFAIKQSQSQCNMNLKMILGRVLLASGVVSSLSLLCLLLPRFYGLIVLFISWALFVVISALPLLLRAFNGLLTGITTVINILICSARNLFPGSNLSQQQPPPPASRPRV